MRPDAPVVQLGLALRALVVDGLLMPSLYAPPVVAAAAATASAATATATTMTVRAFAGSGTGNGDSFMCTVAALARLGAKPSAAASTAVAGPGGEPQRSAGERWGARGEGEGGIIGTEVALVRGAEGRTLEVRSEITHNHNCGGMYRAWIDDEGKARCQVFKGVPSVVGYEAESAAEGVRRWCSEETTL